MNGKPNETDWKKFRAMVPELRERYLKKINQGVADILHAPDKTHTDQFWDAFEKMKKESKILQDCLDGHTRSSMTFYMVLMCGHGMIERSDLGNFSEELSAYLSDYIK